MVVLQTIHPLLDLIPIYILKVSMFISTLEPGQGLAGHRLSTNEVLLSVQSLMNNNPTRMNQLRN